MKPQGTRFRPTALPSIAAWIAIPCFIALGQWQLDRAEQKRQLADQLANNPNQDSMQIGHDPLPAEPNYNRVHAVGRFELDQQIFIENRKHRGNNGFHVITPFSVAGEQRFLLVNRGWVADANEATAAPTGQITINGLATVPLAPALQLTDDNPGLRWPWLTLEKYSHWSGLNLYPALLLQSPDDPGSFVREWTTPPANDAMHIGYAIQWFAFAVIAAALWLRYSLRAATSKQEQLSA